MERKKMIFLLKIDKIDNEHVQTTFDMLSTRMEDEIVLKRQLKYTKMCATQLFSI